MTTTAAAHTAAAPPPPVDTIDRALLKLAGIMLVGTVVVQLDATIVSVAIDHLGRAFHTGIATTQWVSTSYLLALAMVIPLGGWSVERFGAKHMWIFSLTAFGIGSALCGSAWSAGSLIGFRVLQGLGGGLLLPLMQTILAQAAGPRRMGRLMATVAVPGMLVPIFGPVVGGIIVDSLSWRWIFLVNIPVCAVAVILAVRGLPVTHQTGRRPLDVLGLLLLSPGLAGVVFGFSEAGTRHGFGHAQVIAPVAAGAALIVLFVAHSRRAPEPIIDPRLFRSKAFTGSGVMMLMFGMSLYGAMLLLPLYEQQVRGRDAVWAGLLLAPQGFGMMLALMVVGRLTDSGRSRTIVLAGLLINAAGTFAYTQAGVHTSEWLLGASLTVRGIGLGAATVPVLTTAYFGLRPTEIPRATSATRILQQVGGSVGTAVLAVILARGITANTHGGHVSSAGLAAAYDTTFWWTFAFTLIAVPFSLLLPNRRADEAMPAESPMAAVAPGPHQLGAPQPGSSQAGAAQS